MTRGISVLASLVFTATAVGQSQIPQQVLGRIKDSTVYVKTSAGPVVPRLFSTAALRR